MDIIILPDKGVSETIPVTVIFSDRLQSGETVNGASVTASVFAGTDASPSSILSGSATYTANSVTQNITAGTAGVIYTLVFIATGSASHNYGKIARLAVVSDSNPY